jgi:beta-lactamase class A
MRFLLFTLIIWMASHLGYAQHEDLKRRLQEIASSVEGNVGIAMMDLATGDTITVNNDFHYPMQSVYKFPLALAVLHEVDRHHLALDQKIHVTKDDLLPDTWSPLAEKYPDGNVDLTLEEILLATVSLSDNNGCDILFRLLGGPKKVEKFIQGLGIREMTIALTEEEMHLDWNAQFENWCTPSAMVELLNAFHRNGILSQQSYYFLMKAMRESPTGPRRIKGLLPEDVVVAHKTGTGGKNKHGITGAVNDVGIVSLPNRRSFALVVFVSNTKISEARAEDLIAKVSKTVYDYYNL